MRLLKLVGALVAAGAAVLAALYRIEDPLLKRSDPWEYVEHPLDVDFWPPERRR